MDAHDAPTAARAFGRVAEAYHRGRPGYPLEAVRWAVGEEPATVLEIGAGTGRLTEQLVALGHAVHATDPDPAMLAVLAQHLPDVRTTVAPAEALPVAHRSVDVVVCAQAFHWLDAERALAEAARVLRPGGTFAVLANRRDERIPWVKRLGRILGSPVREDASAAALAAAEAFGEVEETSHRSWQTIDRDTVQDLALSRSHVALLDDDARARLLAQVAAFYDDYGRGMYGMELPYVTAGVRARLAARATLRVDDADGTPRESLVVDTGSHPAIPDELLKAPRASTDLDDTAMLLIDFR